MKTLAALALLLGACVEGSEPLPNFLPADAYFSGLVPGYSSPEDCTARAPDPRGCWFEIALCATGQAGMREGDVVNLGSYTTAGPSASVEFADLKLRFHLDVETGQASSEAPLTTWLPDSTRWMTQEFDTISCN